MPNWPDDDAFQAIIDQYDDLRRLAIMLTGSAHSGEDALQDALVAVARHWAKQRPNDPLAYTRQVVARKAIDQRRRVRTVALAVLPDRRDEPDFLRFESDRNFFRLLQNLGARQRMALVLRYFAGYSDNEIADTLNCSPSTVRSQIHRGLTHLRAAAPTPDHVHRT